LFIHGEQDIPTFTSNAGGRDCIPALNGAELKLWLVGYLREGHGLREPKHRVDAAGAASLAWFDVGI